MSQMYNIKRIKQLDVRVQLQKILSYLKHTINIQMDEMIRALKVISDNLK